MKVSNLNIRQIISVFVLFFLIFIELSVIYLGGESNSLELSYFVFFNALIILCLFKFNNISFTSLGFLFFISLNIFIFGRFYAVLISSLIGGDYNYNIQDIFLLNWMTLYVPTYDESIKIFSIINIFFVLFYIGYIVTWNIKYKSGILSIKGNMKNINKIKIIFYIITLFKIVSLILVVKSVYEHGYLSLYSNQTQGKYDSAIINMIFYVLFSILIVFDTKNYKKYLFILFCLTLISGLTGSRGALVTGLLTILYIYGLNYRINLKKLILYCSIVFFLMMIILSLSSREDSSLSLSVSEFIPTFLYKQGVTLGVISYSLADNLVFPIHTKLQALLPLVFRFVSAFEPINFYTANISTFISYSANPMLFNNGNGLGSSIISEIYILSSNIVLFAIISFFLGSFLAKSESLVYSNSTIKILLLTVVPIVIFSPRSGLNMLTTALIYSAVILYIIKIIILNKKLYEK
ncbi:O-antigen polysaccharide polymerase Wzy [Photobacterium sp. S4TG1]|uniref:O-antigen polysaccharide polymerase Wzy n=1 Tax=Photobacterium sp. S4TG1 TaxID=3114587 RepID=UPI002E16F6A2|nr:O-antigen polysaccharide polymerase Wzy [Photobacterium sp. S4TG1]